MGEFLEEWAGAGLTPVTLPSGREVRLKLPEPRDLIVRGLLPTELIELVLAKPDVDWSVASADDPELAGKFVDSMRIMAADSIRQGRRSIADEWESITVSVETYRKLPDDDKELIENKILAKLDENDVAATPEAQRAAREEAAATVGGYREFRDKQRRPAGRKSGGAVRTAPIDPDRTSAADGGAGGRPRARRAPRGG